MSRFEGLLARVRGEYREMPGLVLSRSEACRLWQVDLAACEVVLNALVEEGFLRQLADGRFVAWPAAKPLKVDLVVPAQRRTG
jgi:hypothetical protein